MPGYTGHIPGLISETIYGETFANATEWAILTNSSWCSAWKLDYITNQKMSYTPKHIMYFWWNESPADLKDTKEFDIAWDQSMSKIE